MYSIYYRRARSLVAAFSAVAALVLLPGCQGHKIVARINTVAINENDLVDRALNTHVTQAIPGMDVGGYTLIMMIKEELTHQLADVKHAAVSQEDAESFAEFTKRMDPTFANAILSGNLSDEEFERDRRLSLEQIGIGTEGAKAEDRDIQAKYDDLTKAAPGQKPKLEFPELWTVRMMPFGDEATAERAIDMLKTQPFPVVAQQLLPITPVQAQQATRDTVVNADNVQMRSPALYTAMSALSPGQVVAQPVPVQLNNPQTNTPQQGYLVAQMVKQVKAEKPTLQQARTYLNVLIITSTRPQWSQHANQALAAFTQASAHSIQINVDRYKPLLSAYILPQAATYVTPGGGIPSGLPPAAGSATPPPGSGSPAPGPGASGTAPAPGAGSAPSAPTPGSP